MSFKNNFNNNYHYKTKDFVDMKYCRMQFEFCATNFSHSLTFIKIEPKESIVVNNYHNYHNHHLNHKKYFVIENKNKIYSKKSRKTAKNRKNQITMILLNRFNEKTCNL